MLIASLLLACSSDVSLTETPPPVRVPDDPSLDEDPVELPETAVGIDRLVQTASPDIDVLVVLDTSCSMTRPGRLTDVGTAALELATDLDEADGVDSWSIAFVTADNARLDARGPFYDLDTQGADIFAAPSTLLRSEAEFGLAAATTALSEDLVRDGASLFVVFISDSDEQSSVSTGTFVQTLDEARPYGNVDVAAVVATDDSDCKIEGPGDRYVATAAQFGNAIFDVCESDKADLFHNTVLTDIATTVPLTHVPEVDSLVVMSDGETEERWFYDADTNEVVLEFVPVFGQVVEVAYSYVVD